MANELWKLRAVLLALLTTSKVFIRVCIFSVLIKILQALPRTFVPKRIPKQFLDNKSPLNVTHKTFLQMLQVRYTRAMCNLKVGMRAPNINILTVDRIEKKLLDYEKEGRPLIVNFGSCT